MSILTYPESKVIDEVAFKKTANGAVRAYLHARDGLDAPTVQNLLKSLRDADYECIPYTLDGKPTVEVRGFKRESKLIQWLGEQHWIEGKLKVKKEAEDHIGWMDMIRQRTLQASGIFYLVGDACYATYGYKKGHWEDVLAGLFYFGGSSALMAYGSNDQADLQIRDIAKKIKDEVQRQGLDLPDNCSLSSIAADHSKGLLKTADELLRRYPAETMNTFFGMAGACIAASTFRHHIFQKPDPAWSAQTRRDKKLSSWLDVGLGTMTMASGAVSALVEEKAHDPDEPPPTGITDKIKDFVQRRPLAIAGMGYIISTLCHAASTYKDIKTANRDNDTVMMKSVPYRAVFVGANLIAELLMSISSKGHGAGVVSDTSVDESAISIAADLVVKQPPNMQNQLIDQMGKFLGGQNVLALGDEEAIRKLREKVEALRKNPWADAEIMGPKILPVAAQPEASKWQTKMAARDAAPPQLELPA